MKLNGARDNKFGEDVFAVPEPRLTQLRDGVAAAGDSPSPGSTPDRPRHRDREQGEVVTAPRSGPAPASRLRAIALTLAIREELHPDYHVTPGGLKWSKATDAITELVNTAKGQAEALVSCISAQERVCEHDKSVDAWTVLAHLRVMWDDLYDCGEPLDG